MTTSIPLVIVLNWNGEQELLDCLASLEVARLEYSEYPFDVLLVDNGSTSGVFEDACRRFPWVNVLALPANLYWAGGNNEAIVWALQRKYSWLVLCNSDIVVDGRWSRALARFDGLATVGAIGFNVLGECSRVPFAEFDQARREFSFEKFFFVDEDYISGCFLAIRPECFERLGLFDLVYRMYSEEDDFLMRVRLAGWRTVRCNAPIWHASELASRRVPLLTAYLAIRNGIRFRLKFDPAPWRSSLVFVVKVCFGMLNPWRRVDLVNSYRRRLKPSANPLINLSILLAACIWNLRHLAETKMIAKRERQLAAQVRC